MKFTIESQIITAMLTDIAKAVPAKPTLPILSNVLVEVSGELVRLTATDSEIALRGIVKPDTIEAADGSSTTVPAKLLLDLLKTLPGGPVTFELQPVENSIKILWKNGESALPVFDPSEFVNIAVPEKDKEHTFDTTTDTLSKAIAKTLFAIGTDDIRPVLKGLLFDIKSGETNIVASDASKLVIYKLKTPDVREDASFILPGRSAAILKGTLPKEQPIKVVFDDKNARFAFGAMELTTRLVVGKYPAYHTIIPTKNENILVTDRSEIIGILRRMCVVADKHATIIKADMAFNSVCLSAEDLGLATKGSEKLECDYDGTEMKVGVKGPTLIDILSNIEADSIEIRLASPSKAILIQPAEGERNDEPYMGIVMPLRLNA